MKGEPKMFENLETSPEAVIKVVGIGGAGGNAVNEMMRRGLKNVSFLALNTDAQALKKSEAEIPVQIGQEATNGYGAGANPKVGYEAAVESEDLIRSHLEGTDMLFIACGLGGGTGTGASPVVARIASEMDILTVAVVTKPFSFEGKKRMNAAEAGLNGLREYVKSMIVIDNNKLREMLPAKTSFLQALKEADNVLSSAVYTISEVITASGLINVDFADVKTVMESHGRALMGAGEATGENRAEQAASKAIESPLLEDFEMKAAKGILCTITHGMDFSIDEMTVIGDKVQSLASNDATVVIGTIPDPEMDERCVVTVIATGIDGEAEALQTAQVVNTQAQTTKKTEHVPVSPSKPLVTTPVTAQPVSQNVSEVVRKQPAVQMAAPARAETATENSTIGAEKVTGAEVPTKAKKQGGLFSIPEFLK